MSISAVSSRLAGILIALLAGAPNVLAAPELTLTEAERLALEQAPGLARARASVAAVSERTTYEGRLPDPQLVIGALNVPADSYSFRQEDMTMTMVGVRQSFPPGDTLGARTRRAERELDREQARLEIERRNLLRQVRATWLELYYANQSLLVLDTLRPLARRDLETAEARYRAAQDSQRAVFRARQALARIDEREPMLRALAERARMQLARWIGEAARDPLPAVLPPLSALPARFDTSRHPEWLAAQAELESMRAEVNMARQDYKPGWMFDLSYGFRRPMPDGTERPNMMTAMVTLDLPIFRSKRQDRRLAESQSKEAAAHYETEDKRRELEAMYGAMLAEHQAVQARVRVLEETLLPNLRREAQSTLAGFAREQAELRDARMRQIDAELELVRLRVDLSKTHTELLYLTGEEP